MLRVDGPDDQASNIFIVEVQLRIDAGKLFSWHFYAAGARLRFRCPATVLVVTPDERVASWAARSIDVDRVGNQFRPLVLGPATVPLVTDIDTAHALPELAVLSAVMHGRDQGAEDIGAVALVACRQLENPRGRIYADIIFDSMGEIARAALEKLMDLRGYKYPQSDFVKKHYYDGQRDQLLRQLARKFGELPGEVSEKIRGAEPEELTRWSDRFVDVSSLEAVFAAES